MGDERPRKSLDDLDARLREARSKEASRSRGSGPALRVPSSGFGMAFRIGVEMVAALIVGVGIGLLLDRWLGTAPWFLIVFFLLGAAAGVLNVYRAAAKLGLGAGTDNPAESPESPREGDRGNGPA